MYSFIIENSQYFGSKKNEVNVNLLKHKFICKRYIHFINLKIKSPYFFESILTQ